MDNDEKVKKGRLRRVVRRLDLSKWRRRNHNPSGDGMGRRIAAARWQDDTRYL
jgi:hypothetical protein